MDILPAILTDDEAVARMRLERLKPLTKMVHFDVIDGEFVNNTTVAPEICSEFVENFEIEAHLMVAQPVTWIDRCADLGIRRLIAQVEALPKHAQSVFVDNVLRFGLDVGLGIDVETDIFAVATNVWVWLDKVLVMGVPVGWGGQDFHPNVLQKVRQLQSLRDTGGYAFRIEIDGGVHEETIKEMAAVRPEMLVVGSALWKDENVDQNLQKLRRLAV